MHVCSNVVLKQIHVVWLTKLVGWYYLKNTFHSPQWTWRFRILIQFPRVRTFTCVLTIDLFLYFPYHPKSWKELSTLASPSFSPFTNFSQMYSLGLHLIHLHKRHCYPLPTHDTHPSLCTNRLLQCLLTSRRPLISCLTYTATSSRASTQSAFRDTFYLAEGLYLTSRYQRVMLDGHLSSSLPVTSGVPQGTILGPLLFNIFMNPISKVQLSPNTRIVLCADDILLSKLIDNAKDKDLFQNDLVQISNWFEEHGLRINHLKTQLLQVSRCKGISPLSSSLNGHVTHPSPHVKYLGVTLTPTLSWSLHISKITRTTEQLHCT